MTTRDLIRARTCALLCAKEAYAQNNTRVAEKFMRQFVRADLMIEMRMKP